MKCTVFIILYKVILKWLWLEVGYSIRPGPDVDKNDINPGLAWRQPFDFNQKQQIPNAQLCRPSSYFSLQPLFGRFLTTTWQLLVLIHYLTTHLTTTCTCSLLDHWPGHTSCSLRFFSFFPSLRQFPLARCVTVTSTPSGSPSSSPSSPVHTAEGSVRERLTDVQVTAAGRKSVHYGKL